MSESIDAFRYIGYLRSRWRAIVATAATAVVLAAVASLLMPRRYTATARIVIEPPAGTDLRSAMAVSPIYLESLKTYEIIAASDNLFRRAVERYALSGGPIEALKSRILRVQIVRNTRIIEISVTLPDAKKAQALAKFLADSTVDLNRASVSESDEELLRGLEQQAKEIRGRLEEVEGAWAKAISTEPVAGIEAEMDQTVFQRSNLQEQVQSTQLEIAELAERMKAGESPVELRKQDSNARARLAEVRKQLLDLEAQNAQQEKLLGVRQAHREKLEAERKAGQTALAAMEARLRDARGESGFRGERLKVIDPGIVPERPSSPNLPLNLAAALLAGLALPILYFTLQMSFEERRASVARGGFRARQGA